MRTISSLLMLFGVAVGATPALADVDFANRTGTGPITASHSGLCLTVPGGSTTAGTPIDQEPCNGTPAQIWQVKASSNGFTLVNQATGQCLDSQTSATAGGAVVQRSCGGGSQQTWSAKAQGGGFGLVTAYSGQCLDVSGGSTASGGKLIQWGCSGAPNQTFVSVSTVTPISFANRGGVGPIKASHSGLCLTVPGASTTMGTQIDQEPCNGSDAQNWQVNASGSGFSVVNRATGQCLDSQPSKTAGGAVLQWGCNGSSQQTWSAKAQGSGFGLVAAYSGLCLDVFNYSSASGAKLIQWGCSGAPNQTFVAVAASTGTGSTGTGGTTTGGTGGTGTGSGSTAGGTGGIVPPGVAPPASTGLIVAKHSAMCVENPGGSTAAGTGIDQWPCEPNATHMDWTFVPAGSGYQIQNARSGLCLTVTNGSTANGAGTSQQPCGTGAGSLWTFRKTGAFYEVVATHSGRCLNIYSGSRDNNAAVIQWDCTLQDNAVFSLVPPAPPSAWTPLTTIGIVPVSATVMPSGKVMMWAAETKNAFGAGTANGTWITVFDPGTGTSSDTYVANTNHDMFCPGTNLLPDGRMMITGGISSGATSIYNPDTNAWSTGPTLKIPRGYNSNVTLSTGETLTYGGSWSGDIGGKNAEVWSAATGSWRVLSNVLGNTAAEPGVDMYRADNHFWMFGVSNGYVFQAGPSHEMHWIATGGNGSLTSAGNRADDTFSINGTATMFDVNRIFKAGGAAQYQNQPANGATYTIDIGGGPGATPTVAAATPLQFARAFHNSVILPNGEVIVVGGQTVPIPFTDSTPVYYPELWSPTKNTVVRLAPISVPRNYHSVALLLPDGRVLSAGGGLCNCAADHPNLQILTPPYLYGANGQLASRPAITSAPTTAALGSKIGVTTDRGIQSFSLVRVGSTTHTVDNDQRRVPLTISGASGTQYSLALPSDPGIVTPGSWMLFALDANGVPSVARIVRIR